MFTEVLKNLPALLLTFGAALGAIGLLTWIMAAQGAADRRMAYACWGVGAVLGIWALIQIVGSRV
jgi:hypothetical protein